MQSYVMEEFLRKLARCRTLSDVSGVAIDGAKTIFGIHAGGALFFDETLRMTDRVASGMRHTDLDEYERHWWPQDRVFSAVVKRGVPVHNWQVYCESTGSQEPIFAEYGRRFGLYHYMALPIFGAYGTLSGVLSVCRRPNHRSFDCEALATASVFSGFLSATQSRVIEGAENHQEDSPSPELTPREWQVARLVAAGRNNLEIALRLGIARETVKQTLRRVYRKMDVSGRAQMAARLFSRNMPPS